MQVQHVGPVVELLHEAPGQLGAPVEEVLLQGGERPLVQGPQEPLLAEERVVGEQAVHGWSLAHVKQERDRSPKRNPCPSPGPRCFFLNVFSLVLSCRWACLEG